MSYESADYINELNKNLPLGSDSVSEGDIHLRTIKLVLQNSFPNVDVPVNAIHTGPTEPVLHSAGTVWFDTSSGLIKLRDKDDAVWLKMAHGEASGIGQLLKADWYESEGEHFRHGENEIFKITVNPLSDTSTYFVNVSGQTGAWCGGLKQYIYCKLMDLTTDVQIGTDFLVAGFNHVDDVGNFEIHGNLNFKERYQNHPATSFELSLLAWAFDPDSGGGDITNVKVEVLEIE